MPSPRGNEANGRLGGHQLGCDKTQRSRGAHFRLWLTRTPPTRTAASARKAANTRAVAPRPLPSERFNPGAGRTRRQRREEG